MKQQWTLIFGLVFALVIAVFSVVNVESVPVNFVFGTAMFPLILVILGSALAGGLVLGLFGTIRIVRLNRRIRQLERELQAANEAASQSLVIADTSTDTVSTAADEEPSTSSASDDAEGSISKPAGSDPEPSK